MQVTEGYHWLISFSVFSGIFGVVMSLVNEMCIRDRSVSIYSQSIIFKFLYTIVSQELNQKKMEKKKYIKPILE